MLDIWPNLPSDFFEEFCDSGMSVVVAVPDLNSVLGVRKIAKHLNEHELSFRPLCVLNKFDSAHALHAEILQWFQHQFPESEIVTLRRTDETSEALAEGCTVLDYAPESGIAEDYARLADVIRRAAGQNRRLKSA